MKGYTEKKVIICLYCLSTKFTKQTIGGHLSYCKTKNERKNPEDIEIIAREKKNEDSKN